MLKALGSLAAALWAALRPGTVLLGAVVFLLLADFLKRRRPKNYPPGPPRLPFVGNFFQLDFEEGHLSLQRFVKKYGNLFSLEFGDLPSVVITGLPLIKEVLVHQDQNFVSRPITPIRERVFKKSGLIMSNGHIWKEQRRFSLTALRNFGLGRKSLEEQIQEETAYLIQTIGEENGQPFNPHFKINNAVSNIICSITFGERFDYQDDQFQELLRLLDAVTYLETTMWCQLYNVFPRIMNFLPGPHQMLFSNWGKLKMFVARMIENHKRDWNPTEARDFIDAYFQETEKHKGNAASSFHEENLIYSTLDLFFAGTETTSTTLRWGLLYMALYPEIQGKVQAEIDKVLGELRQPSMAARESMPYTNAVIHEVQRMGNILPLNVPREVTVDTILAGYHLPKELLSFDFKRVSLKHFSVLLSHFSRVRLCATPSLGLSRQEQWSGLPFPFPMHKSESEVAQSCLTLSDPMHCSPPDSSVHGIFQGTMVLTNLTALHRDPAEWATPDTFNPEHFLENGQFKKREAFLPFSLGKRMCLGEQLARTELFIFFTSLLQKFTFRPPDNEELSLKFRMGLTLSPVSHHLCAVPRA
ncbi:cytochrome P450 2J2-like isoform X2 [Odocoileus virginianus]|uniref:Cytochrome P450 2J2-like isoform X2 n=1 Tax=Odocoileus virginianus TaxID=9874 RepID=A0ABM4I8N0_ODOVR